MMRLSREFAPRLAWLIATSLAAAAAACQPRPGTECRRSSSCAEGEFCRMGLCVPAVGREDLARAADTREPTPRRAPTDASGTSRPQLPDTVVADDSDAASPPTFCDRGRAPAPQDLVVNEILVNPPSGAGGDANGDGTRDAFDDEFVELVNVSGEALDLGGVKILEGGEVKTTLERVCLDTAGAVVVFGGGTPKLAAAESAGVTAKVAASRLGFSNSGGEMSVRAADGTMLGGVEWREAPAEALTLSPQLDGESYRPHSAVRARQKLSPGRCAGGGAFSTGCPPERPADVGLDAAEVGPADQ